MLVHAILCISSTVNHAIAFSACVSCIRISNHSPWCVPLAGHDQWKQCLIHFAGNCALAHFTGPLIDQDILSLAQLMNSITAADSEGTGRHISSSSSSAPSFPSLCHMAQRLWAPCDARWSLWATWWSFLLWGVSYSHWLTYSNFVQPQRLPRIRASSILHEVSD